MAELPNQSCCCQTLQGHRTTGWRVLSVLARLICVATVASFFARFSWACELASHFRVQYALILLPCAILFLLGHRTRQFLVAGCLAFINLCVIAPFYLDVGAQASPGGSTVRALLANVQWSNAAYGKVRQLVSNASPDLMVFPEANDAWVEELRPLEGAYPFSTYARGPKGQGIALYSRLPLEDTAILSIGTLPFPLLVARVHLDGHRITIIGAHLSSPWNPGYAAVRNEQLVEVARLVQRQSGPVVVLGDLNVTPWSPYFHELLRSSGLRDSRSGFGLQPSWPAWFPSPFRITIDHCLVSREVLVKNRELGPPIGSDHYPVLVDFTVGS